MVHILQQAAQPTIGSALGKGVGEGLNALIKDKMSAMQQSNKIKGSIDEMMKSIKYTGPSNLLSLGSADVREGRQYFDTMAMTLEKIAADMVGKGTLNKERFNFLKSRLPSSDKTQAANLGALKAWANVLGIDFPELQQIPSDLGKSQRESQENDQMDFQSGRRPKRDPNLKPDEIMMIAPDGQAYAVPKKDVKAAKAARYR